MAGKLFKHSLDKLIFGYMNRVTGELDISAHITNVKVWYSKQCTYLISQQFTLIRILFQSNQYTNLLVTCIYDNCLVT